MVSKKVVKSKKNKNRLHSSKKNRFMPGRPGRSLKSLQQDGLMQRALTLQRQGRFAEAEDLFRQILLSDPGQPDALCCLAVLYRGKRMNENALELLNEALASRPNFQKAFEVKIGVLLALDRREEAVATWRQLLAVQTDDPGTINKYGVFLYELGRLDEALIAFRKAVSLEPKYAIAHHNVGNVLRELGQLSDAIVSFKRALNLKPDYVEVIRMLAMMEKHTEIDDEILSYEDMYTNGNLPAEKKVDLGFALGKIYEDLGNYEKAFGFLLEANRLKRMSYKYSVQTDYELFERIKKTFSEDFFSSRSSAGNQDGTPIFIVGMPRSGSTLIEQILGSHPQVYGAGELSALPSTIFMTASRMNARRVPECFSDLDGEALARVGADYIDKVRKYSTDAKYITDKNLFNFLNVGLIKAILPNAKIIHAIRSPMDNCLSIYKNFFTNEKTCKFAYDLTELGQYYHLYEGLMEYWEKVLPGFMHTVKYEELVSDPEGQIRRLLEFCGLQLVEDCLSFHESARTVRTTSFMQVRKPIYKDSVALWRRYEKQLEPLKKALGASFLAHKSVNG